MAHFFPRRKRQTRSVHSTIQRVQNFEMTKKNQVSEGNKGKKPSVTWLLGSLPVRAGNGKVQKVSAV